MRKEIGFEAVVYVLCIALASTLWERPFLLFICYLGLSLLMLIWWHAPGDLILYFVAFVFGTLADIVAVYFGAWSYSKPLYLAPVWLPPLWGIAALLLKRTSETLRKLG
ncbi:MAG: DUF2878 family protein [Candidatus Latescibacterota bacterium]|nr:MAG: DUF2878 family protein [Candidatus Latescibacterota bacterium]